MSVKKLLCGAALASLMVAAPVASALDLTILDADRRTIAEELDFSDDNVAGNLGTISILTNDQLPQDEDFLVTVDLSGPATYNGLSTAAITGADVAGKIISSGGADGSTSVVFLITTDTDGASAAAVGADFRSLTLSLPIVVSGCSTDVSVDINLSSVGGTPIEGGAASLVLEDTADAGDATSALSCEDGFELTFAEDDADTGTGAQTLLALDDGFTNFVDTASDDPGAALLADLELVVNAVAGADLTSPIVEGDVDSIDFNVVLADTTGIEDLVVAGAISAGETVTTDDATGTTYAFSLGTVTEDVGTLTANLTDASGDGDQITRQDISITDLLLDFGAGFVDESVSGTSDSIELEGESFGPFDWVGDASAPTANRFRVTGLTAVSPAAVNLSNCKDTSKNGIYDLDLSSRFAEGSFAIRPVDIEATDAGAFGQCDVEFTFFSADTNIDVDRLMETGGIVSAFGNEGVAADTPDPDHGDD